LAATFWEGTDRARLRAEHVGKPQLVRGGILQEQLGLDLVQMRQHLRASRMLVAFVDRGDDLGMMISAAGGRVVTAIEQDDQRGARDQLLEEAEIDAVTAHLSDEPVKVAGEPDRGARVTAQLGFALLSEVLLKALDPRRRNGLTGVIDDGRLDQAACLEDLAGVRRGRTRNEGAAVL